MSAVAARPRDVKSEDADRETLPRPTGEQHFLLRDVSWQAYIAIGDALADRPGLRLTYDRGNLEFMSTSPKHEVYKKHLARFIEILAEELNRAFTTAGNMTFQREDLERAMDGIEFRRSHELLDEIPSAYKDIDQVMENARSLVEVRHVLKQFLNVKGD